MMQFVMSQEKPVNTLPEAGLQLDIPKDYLCAISKNSVLVLEKKIFKGLVNRKNFFAFFHIQSSAKMPVGGVSP